MDLMEDLKEKKLEFNISDQEMYISALNGEDI